MRRSKVLLCVSLCATLPACKEAPKESRSETDQVQVEVKRPTAKAANIAREISIYMDKINAFAADNNYDSLTAANAALSTFLEINGKEHPELLDMDLPGTDTMSINVLSSDDRKFRIYSWDTRMGGTMRSFYGSIQYKTSNGSDVKVLNDEHSEEGDSGLMYRYIKTIKTLSGKVYYLVLYRGVYSTKDVVDGISAFSIENDKINDTLKVFRTAKGELNDISYGYDFLSNIDDNTGGQKNEIHLDENKTTLYIPIVNEAGIVSGKSLVYKFDGNKFVYDKNAH